MRRPANRRSFLAAVAGLGLAGCSTKRPEPSNDTDQPTTTARRSRTGSSTTTRHQQPGTSQSVIDEFVVRDGAGFVVDGEPFRFSGANNTWLPVPFEPAEGLLAELIPEARDLGMNVLRTLAYGAGIPGDYHPAPDEYNEQKFRALDAVIQAAGQQGIRLILPLVNGYGKWYAEGMMGGMDQYVEWSSTAEKHNDFYTDSECRTLYREYVEYVLTRENTLTELEYREDPTIMMWELANEPHLRDHDTEREMTAEDHAKMQAWIDEMAHFIKGVDGNHLVSTGSEGLYGDETFPGTGNRTDYLGDHQSSAIDAASFHFYPGYGPEAAEWIQRHVVDAHEKLGKPAYLGEFGAATRSSRAALFEEVYDAVLESGGDGAMFWQLIGHDGRTGELRRPNNPRDPDSAYARFIYYPESDDVIPEITQFSAEVTGRDSTDEG